VLRPARRRATAWLHLCPGALVPCRRPSPRVLST